MQKQRKLFWMSFSKQGVFMVQFESILELKTNKLKDYNHTLGLDESQILLQIKLNSV